MSKEKTTKKIVVLGGGTGTSVVLRGLRKYEDARLSAIISTADSGGSSGVLREEIDMVPPGDIRQCFVALNEDNNKFLSVFNERFHKGSFAGHAFGNLFFALFAQDEKDFTKVMKIAEDIVEARHKVVPATKCKTDIVAYLNDDNIINNQEDLKLSKDIQGRLERLEVLPKGVELNEEVEGILSEADMIVIGPGDVVSSVSPPLLVDGMVELINQSRAKKVFVSNIFNMPNVTGFSVYDYLKYFEKHIGVINFDTVVYNDKEIQKDRLDNLGISQDEILLLGEAIEGINYLHKGVVSEEDSKIIKGDLIKRPPLKHDSDKIAKVLYELVAD